MVELSGQKVELSAGATAWLPCHISTDSIGQGTNIGALSHIGRDVTIGQSCRIQGTVYIADGCSVGDEVFIGPGAVLTNDRYPPSNGKWKPVIVENRSIIGANATIVAGVKLHTGCIIAAGAVVICDIPANEVWGGNPAKHLMMRSEYESRRDNHE